MNKLKAVKQVLLNRPLIYNVEFDGEPIVKISKNSLILIIKSSNVTIDFETKYKFDRVKE